MNKSRTKLVVAFVAGVLVLALAVHFTRGEPVIAHLPKPNGYDDFIQASQEVHGTPADFGALDHDALREAIATNAEPLRRLRLGLTLPRCLPMDAGLTNGGLTQQLGQMKQLVRLLVAEGRLHELENQPGKAARSYADAIRFGNEMSRGGYLIIRLVGISCEASGYTALSKLVPRLGPEESRSIISDLEKVDAGRVTWAEVRRDERAFCVRHHGGMLMHPVLWTVGWWQSREAIGKTEMRHKTVMAHERLLIAELALRVYQAEQGHPPARLEELAGKYFSEAPQDPFGTQPMVYRPQGTNWLLYSVGPDGLDNGGKPMGGGPGLTGDMFINSP